MTLKETKPGEQKIRVITGVIELVDLKKPKNTKDGVFYPVKIKEDNPNLKHPNTYDAPEGIAAVLKTMEDETVALDLKLDRVKDKREDDGQIGSYWWSIKGVHHAKADEAPRDDPDGDLEDPSDDQTRTITKAQIQAALKAGPKKEPVKRQISPEEYQESVNPWPEVRGDVQGHLEKIAADWLFGMYTPDELSVLCDEQVARGIRQNRHYLYWHVKERPIEPREFCWEHDTPFLHSQKSGIWAHQIDGAICYRDGDLADPADQEEDEDEPDWNAGGREL